MGQTASRIRWLFLAETWGSLHKTPTPSPTPSRDTAPVGGDVSGGKKGLHTGGPGAGEILVVRCSAGHKGHAWQVWGQGESDTQRGIPRSAAQLVHRHPCVIAESPADKLLTAMLALLAHPGKVAYLPYPSPPHTTHAPAAGTRCTGGHRPHCGSCRFLQWPNWRVAAPGCPAGWPSPLAVPWHLLVSIALAS